MYIHISYNIISYTYIYIYILHIYIIIITQDMWSVSFEILMRPGQGAHKVPGRRVQTDGLFQECSVCWADQLLTQVKLCKDLGAGCRGCQLSSWGAESRSEWTKKGHCGNGTQGLNISVYYIVIDLVSNESNPLRWNGFFFSITTIIRLWLLNEAC